MDILPDGSLDYDDEILAQLDLCNWSYSSALNQSEEQIMERLANACRNPYVRHIAHPTGRIIGRRDGYKPNIEQLMALAERNEYSIRN